MRKRLSNKWVINYIICFITLFLVEILFRVLENNSLFNWSLLRIFISSNVIAIIIGFVLSFFKTSLAMVFQLLLNFIVTLYAFVQLGFNNYLGVYMSLNASSQFGAVVDYIGEYFKSFKIIYYLILIPFILLIVYYIFFNKKIIVELPKIKKSNRKNIIIKKIGYFLIIELCLCCGYYFTLVSDFMQNNLQLQSNKKLFINPNVPSVAIKQLGVLTFGLSDLRISVFPIKETETVIEYNKASQKATDYTRNIDDEAFEMAALNEKNVTYANLNNYFISQKITDKNEYTGLFDGKNVIVIMMESINDIIINEELYPNFYKLYSEGWHWENNYSPRNSCSTGNNELSGMVGLYSIYNSCTANIYKKNTYFTSIFNLFNKKGYYTTSMHDYTEAYYYRNTIHRNMGVQNYYGVQQLGISFQNEYRNWASDADFMNSFLNIMDGWNKDQPFMTWLTTVSSHQPYSVSSILGDKYLNDFKDLDYPTDLKRYMSKVKELDEGLGILIEGLKTRNMLEDTVIVLYGDHYPYGLSQNTISKVISSDLSDYEIERVPFVIYNSKLPANSYNEYTSYINIVPTLANLCNLDYDPRLYVGQDLLSNDYNSLVIFADGSWKNEYAYYNASNGNVKFYVENYYTEAEIKEINYQVDLKIKMNNSAIKSNYFNYLDNALQSNQAIIENGKNANDEEILPN